MMLKKTLLHVMIFSIIITSIYSFEFSAVAVSSEFSSAPNLYYEDFETNQLGVLPSLSGTYQFKVGEYEIADDSGNKIMRLRQTADSGDGYPLWRIVVSKDKFSSASKIILEYKVRLNNSNQYSFLRSREKGTYGTYLPFFYQNKIYDKDYIANPQAPAIGEYANNEWVTITSVHDIEAVDGKARRETYINGQYAYTSLDDYESGTNSYLDHGGDFRFNFSIRTGRGADEYVDIDYIKIYTEPENFALRVPNTETVDTNTIDVEFNNIPKLTDLNSKIYIKDENEDVISVSHGEMNMYNNIGTDFAQSYTLHFSNLLDFDTEYTIVFDNMADINGNIVNKEEKFKTRKPKIYAKDFRVYKDGTEQDNLSNGTLDIKYNLKNESYSDLSPVLFVPVYNSENQMVDLMTKLLNLSNQSEYEGTSTITLNGTENTRMDIFVVQGIDNPVPVSGIASYTLEGKSLDVFEEIKALYQGDAVIKCDIDNDNQIITANIDTKDKEFNRETILFALKENKTIETVDFNSPLETFLYTGMKKIVGQSDAFSFKIPDVRGLYNIELYINNSNVKPKDSFEFYGVEFIFDGIKNINDATTGSNVEEFLNDYEIPLGIDMADYNELGEAGKKQAALSIIGLRNERTDKKFANTADILSAIKTAVLMGEIADGNDLVSIMSRLTLDKTAIDLYKNSISEQAKEHLILQLQGGSYLTPSVFSDAFTKQVVISGIYKAESYTQTRLILSSLKEKIGLDFSTYNTLENKSIVDSNMSGQLFNSYLDLRIKFNEYTSNRKKEEQGNSSSSSTSGGGRSGGSYGAVTFEKPQPQEELNNEKEDIKKDAFADMGDFGWAKEAVLALSENGVLQGKSEGLFAPSDYITRAEFIKMIVEAFDVNTEDKEIEVEFNDVNENDWYYKFAKAALSNQLITGVTKNEFSPDGIITREMAAVILYRTAQLKGLEFTEQSTEFKDMADVGDYAYDAVSYLSGAQVISGFDTGMFMPKQECNRAQGAQLIYNLLKVID